jgi:hypothetical protein
MGPFISTITLGLALSAGGADPHVADPPVLIELFTSEGCSSCPPADALLERITHDEAMSVRVIALGEHVDYWDRLGWKDRFSSPRFTQRQEAYARRMGLTAVYTPQVVVGGHAQALGSDAPAVSAAIAQAGEDRSGRVSLRFQKRGGNAAAARAAEVALVIDAHWKAGVEAQVLVALVQDHATSQVERGENAGRTLVHAAVVRRLSTVGAGRGAFSGEVRLPLAEAPEADRVVVFVQERDGGRVHAAEAADLRQR